MSKDGQGWSIWSGILQDVLRKSICLKGENIISIFQVCFKHATSMLQACVMHAPSMPQACLKHALSMPQACLKHGSSMCQECFECASSVLQTVAASESWRRPCFLCVMFDLRFLKKYLFSATFLRRQIILLYPYIYIYWKL